MIEADFTLEHAAFTLRVKERLRLEGITAIFGPSGSGKTSLLRVLAGLEPRARGTLRVGGAHWMGPGRAVPPHRRGLGMVF